MMSYFGIFDTILFEPLLYITFLAFIFSKNLIRNLLCALPPKNIEILLFPSKNNLFCVEDFDNDVDSNNDCNDGSNNDGNDASDGDGNDASDNGGNDASDNGGNDGNDNGGNNAEDDTFGVY